MSPNLRIKLDKRLKSDLRGGGGGGGGVGGMRIFLLEKKKKRGEEGVEREAPTYLYDLQRLGGCLPTGQGLKSESLARATCGYQKLQVSPRFRMEGSGSRKLWVQEVFAELPRVIAHNSRGRDSSHLGYFPF